MQSYKSVFYQKKCTFAYHNLNVSNNLSESICLTDHEKGTKSAWRSESLPKIVLTRSQQEECVQSVKPQSVLLPALHLKLCLSLTNFEGSPARQNSVIRKIDL